ncbi:MAG: MBL fold metallo-hydrolase [Anditalea sp.]
MMNEVTFEILGCGDAFASGGKFNTCFYVHTSSFQLLIDCGATSLLALKKNKISTKEIDVIAISHFHGDHFGGLPFFLLDASMHGRTKPLTIISPPGCEEKLQRGIDLFYPGSSDVFGKFPIEFISYHANEQVDSGPLSLEAFPVVHSEKTLPHGLRITIEDKVIGFSGDTSWTDELFKIAHEADLFICECNFYDLEMKGHLNYHTLMANKQQFSCKQLWLTHFGEEMLNKAGEIEMDYAWEGRKVVL